MKTIKTYQCECGEDFYEDDVNCVNCRKPIDKSKLKEEEVADIKYSNNKRIVKEFRENFPTKEQVIKRVKFGVGSWDFTGYFKKKLEELSIELWEDGYSFGKYKIREEVEKLKITKEHFGTYDPDTATYWSGKEEHPVYTSEIVAQKVDSYNQAINDVIETIWKIK